MNLREKITSMDVNILLEGREGLFMLEDAFELVSHLVNSANYEKHPDYMYLDIPEDKKSIGVDDVLPVIQKGYTKPVLLKKTIVIINNMDALTEAAQNKLLLSLEDSPYLFIIGISYHAKLIDTVLSRMTRIKYLPLSKEAFIAHCEGNYNASDAELLYHACDGCPKLILTLGSELTLFQKLHKACISNNRSDIFNILHLVKEKDNLSVYNNLKLTASVLKVMQHSFMTCAITVASRQDKNMAVRYTDIVLRLANDEAILRNSSYSKDNFFRTILYCVEH